MGNQIDLFRRHAVNVKSENVWLRSAMTTTRADSSHSRCITRRWSSFGDCKHGVQCAHDGHAQIAQQCQNVPARRAAINAEFMLQANDIDIREVQKIGRSPIGGKLLLLNFKAYLGRIIVSAFDVVHRHDDALDRADIDSPPRCASRA